MKNLIKGLMVFTILYLGGCTQQDQMGSPLGEDSETRELFVATDGNDENSGSFEEPFESIQTAIDQSEPGTVIHIREGTYYNGFELSNSGEKDKPITIKNYKDEKVIISGERKTMDEDTALIVIENQNHIKIQGMTIQNLSTNSSDFAVMGIYVTGNSTDIVIEQNLVQYIETLAEGGNAHGIAVYGTEKMKNIVIQDNIVENLKLGASEALVLNGNIDGFNISGNIVRNNDNIGIDLIGHEGIAEDSEQDYVRNGTIENNTVYNNSSFGNPAYGEDYSAGGIYIDGAKNIIVRANTLYKNDIGIEATSEHEGQYAENITLTENIIYKNHYSGISLGGYDEERGGTRKSLIEANILYQNDAKNLYGGQLLLQDDVSDVDISKNILTPNKNGLLVINPFATNQNNRLNHNIYDTSTLNIWVWKEQEYSDLSDFQTVTNQDTESHYMNVKFQNPSEGNFKINNHVELDKLLTR